VIAEVLRLLRTDYVRDTAGMRCAAALELEAAAGAFLSGDGPVAFAGGITARLRSCASDQHLEVVAPAQAPPAAAAATPLPERDWVESLRLRNFDVPQARKLAGNVGYLELTSFPPPEVAGETVAGAMAFLANTDALIVDLRRNSGGAGAMVAYLSTWFFADQTALTETYRRADGRVTRDLTLPWVPGRRRLTSPLYVLTSRATFSAAEAFAFGLQQVGRAVVVGERTRGGANAGRYRDATNGYRVFIPMATARSPVNGKSWDGGGVVPDLPAPADSALGVAHAGVLRKLLATPRADSVHQRELRWALEGVEAVRQGATVSEAGCRTIAGRYDGAREIACRAGRLWYSRDSGPERPLIALGGSRFLLEGIDGALLRFDASPERGAVHVFDADGTEDVFLRKSP
jgi:hypothetical protein